MSMPEDLKLSQIGSSQLPPPFRGLHSPGVRKHCQIIFACYFRKSSVDCSTRQGDTYIINLPWELLLMLLKQTLKQTPSECFDLEKYCQSGCLLSFPATSAQTSLSLVKNGHSHYARCSLAKGKKDGGEYSCTQLQKSHPNTKAFKRTLAVILFQLLSHKIRVDESW